MFCPANQALYDAQLRCGNAPPEMIQDPNLAQDIVQVGLYYRLTRFVQARVAEHYHVS